MTHRPSAPPRRAVLAAVASLGALAGGVSWAQPSTPGMPQAPPPIPRRRREETAPAQQPAGPQFTTEQLNQIRSAEAYLNSIRTARARFSQRNPNGNAGAGTFHIRRPGRLRFEYDPPTPLLIVADGRQVTMLDTKSQEISQWPIGWTAASFLVTENIQLMGGEISVVSVDRRGADVSLTLMQAKRPQDGRVEVVFAQQPMTLKGWSVWDSANNRVDVTLTDFTPGADAPSHLFSTPEPRRRMGP